MDFQREQQVVRGGSIGGVSARRGRSGWNEVATGIAHDRVRNVTDITARRADPLRRDQQLSAPHASSDAAEAAYLITTSRAGDGAPWIRISDRETGSAVTGWQGRVAAYLLESALLPSPSRGVEPQTCDKALVRRLMLAAAAVQGTFERLDAHLKALDARHARPPSLAARLQETGACMDANGLAIARLLFRHPGRHFSAPDVQCLIAIHFPASTDVNAAAQLDTLASNGIIKRIVWDRQRVFYDIDTEPHAHRYDPVADELVDA